MRKELLSFLRCPQDQGALDCKIEEGSEIEVMRGYLTCQRCHRRFVIQEGVPRMVSGYARDEVRKTAATFGYEWTTFTERFAFNEEQFRDLIRPFFAPSFLEGKVVLDAGCGSGMYTQFLSKFGARPVIGLDYSQAVDIAYQKNTYPDAYFVQADLLQPPFPAETFDFVLSKGVLHHLSEPEAGFRSLCRLLKPGGSLVVWVYGQERNSLFTYLLTPLREKLISRLPLGTRKVLSFCIASFLFLILKVIYAPVRVRGMKGLQKILPYYELLVDQSRYCFRHIHFGIFDQISAPIAHYLTRGQLSKWLSGCGFEDFKIVSRWGMSWRVWAVK